MVRTDGLACADGRYREYWEAPTLLRLHEHCTANPDDFVAYGHTKTDDQARTQYTDFLLAESTNRRCMDAMNNGSAACGVNPYTPTHGPCAQNVPPKRAEGLRESVSLRTGGLRRAEADKTSEEDLPTEAMLDTLRSTPQFEQVSRPGDRSKI